MPRSKASAALIPEPWPEMRVSLRGRGRRVGSLGGCLLLVLLVLSFGPGHIGPRAVGAQESLDRVESLVDDSRYAEAREILEAWWEGHEGEPPRTELARGLWYRGLLTVDPSLAEMDYRRLVVEFPGGGEADQALLRLARGADLAGDGAAAARYLQILLQDYPGSPHRVEARALRERVLASNGEDRRPASDAEPEPIPETAAAPEPIAETAAAPEPIPETAAAPEPIPETAAAPEPIPETAAAPEPTPDHPPLHPTSGAYVVQLGAFGSRGGADQIVDRVRRQGFEPRVVTTPGSDLLRVRVGGFEARSDAEDLARILSERGFETHISSDGEEERPGG